MNVKADLDRLLMDSFKELVLTTPVEKITIKEITDKAGVIRPTFYNHFQDKYEVIERIIQEDITSPARALLEHEMVTEAVTLMFANILKEKEFYLRLSHMSGQNSFDEIIKEAIKNLLMEFINEHKTNKQGKKGWFTPENMAEYYSQSISFVVIRWIQRGMDASPRDMSELHEYVLTHSMMEAINDL